MSQEPKSWIDTLREMALKEWILPRLREAFPDGVPTEALEAVLADVNNVFEGKPVAWFNLRRLILSVTNEALAKLGGRA